MLLQGFHELVMREEYIKVINSAQLVFHVEDTRSLDNVMSPHKSPRYLAAGGDRKQLFLILVTIYNWTVCVAFSLFLG